MNIKRKHHFVSQFYLKNWYSINEKIIVSDGNKEFPASTLSIAFEKDFYKLIELTPSQIQFFHKLIDSLELKNTSTYKFFANIILETQEFMRERYEFLDTLRLDIPENLNDIKKEFSFNTLEDKFSYQEATFSKLLNIINQNLEPRLSLSDYDTLVHFFMFQYFKTPKKINDAISHIEGSNIREKFEFSDKQYKFFIMLLSQCFLERIYLSCLSNLYKINIYRNTSRINFITSDDPCFNQKFDNNEFHIQLPISPSIMIELVENNFDKNHKENMKDYFNFNKEHTHNIFLDNTFIDFYNIDEKRVVELNRKIFKNKDRFIYAKFQNDIKTLQQL